MLGLDKQLTEKVDKHISKFSKILKSCLKIKKEDDVLIISDYGEGDKQLAAMMGYGYYQAALKKGLKARIIFQDVKKGFMHADENVIRELEVIENNQVVILSISNKLGRMKGMGKSFRTYCRDRGHRYISATGLGGTSAGTFDLFMEAVNTNYGRMQRKGRKLKRILDKAKEIRIKTEQGTDVTFDVRLKKAIANVGAYGEAGEGGNIPAGEVYIPPRGLEGVEGTVIIDGSVRCDDGTIKLKEPMTLVIAKGRIIKIEGDPNGLLEKTLVRREDRAKFPERVRLIGELGIGINPGAVLVGSSILDEKVLGTAHIAIGSNYWFGGDIRTVVHIDQVFLNPQIFVDGKEIKVQ